MAGKNRGRRGSFKALMLAAMKRQTDEGSKKLSRKDKKRFENVDKNNFNDG